eukprot:Selendium_serpulae@DN6001_c0_g3_i1.p1
MSMSDIRVEAPKRNQGEKAAFLLGTQRDILRTWYKAGSDYQELHLHWHDKLPTEAELKDWDKSRNFIGRAVLEGYGSEHRLPKKVLPLVKINNEIITGKSVSKGTVKVFLPAPIFVQCEVFPFWTRPGGKQDFMILETWLDWKAKVLPEDTQLHQIADIMAATSSQLTEVQKSTVNLKGQQEEFLKGQQEAFLKARKQSRDQNHQPHPGRGLRLLWG